MIGLAIGVGAFAVAVLAAGQMSGEGLYLLGGVAALCAVTTYLSRNISSFLKIFIAIFSVETIVFGLMVLGGALKLWPDAYVDFLPPQSLALTVAIFSILFFLVFFGYDVLFEVRGGGRTPGPCWKASRASAAPGCTDAW